MDNFVPVFLTGLSPAGQRWLRGHVLRRIERSFGLASDNRFVIVGP